MMLYISSGSPAHIQQLNLAIIFSTNVPASNHTGIQQTDHKVRHGHDDVIKWKHFPCYWPFVLGIDWSPVNSPNRGQWRRALMFPLICAWIKVWANNCGDLRCHRSHYDVAIMVLVKKEQWDWRSIWMYMILCAIADGLLLLAWKL